MKYDHFVSQTGKISTVFSPILGDWERNGESPDFQNGKDPPLFTVCATQWGHIILAKLYQAQNLSH